MPPPPCIPLPPHPTHTTCTIMFVASKSVLEIEGQRKLLNLQFCPENRAML